MQAFLDAFHDKTIGVLSCFDRVVFRGHLPLSNEPFLHSFLNHKDILVKDFKAYALRQAERLKAHAKALAVSEGRPFIYLKGYIRKEDKARAMAEADGIDQGLVCVFSVLEPCRSFVLRYGEGRPRLEGANRKCLFLYYYFMDPEFGLMHVRVQTWLPFQIQVYVNAHSWLERRMDAHGIRYETMDNCFAWISDVERAQKFANRFTQQNLPGKLTTFARRVNPLLTDELKNLNYYWVTDQAEFATDVMFKSRDALQTVHPKLLRHSTLSLSAEDVLTFLGRKLHPRFAGEVLTDCKHRQPGARVKHRMKDNWIKMYDKQGCVLRIETVINRPYEFHVRRKAKRKGKTVVGWFPMAKGVSNLYRYAQVSLQANRRYLDALASVADPASSYKIIQKACEPKKKAGRAIRPFNPLAKDDVQLFAAVMRGENSIKGFRNQDLQRQLSPRIPREPAEKRRLAARVTRLIHRLRAHGLVAKFPRSRRYRTTTYGYRLMAAAVHLREEGLPAMLS